jgi:polyhydroxyalkanoate synthesis regulator phasin
MNNLDVNLVIDELTKQIADMSRDLAISKAQVKHLNNELQTVRERVIQLENEKQHAEESASTATE